MKFRYKKLPRPRGKHLSIPIIDVGMTLPNSGVFFSFNCLVDSGADRTYFHAGIGRQLGIDIERGERLPGVGIAGQSFHAYRHKVKYSIGGKEIENDVYFSDELGTPFGILGRDGLFNHFKVCFNERKEEIELKEY